MSKITVLISILEMWLKLSVLGMYDHEIDIVQIS